MIYGSSKYGTSLYGVSPGSEEPVGPVGGDFGVSWSVRTVVEKELAISYSVRGTPVGENLEATWATRTISGNDFDVSWAIKALATRDLDVRWATRTRTGSQLDVQWALRSVVRPDDLAVQWSSRRLTGSQLDVRWEIFSGKTYVTAALVVNWSIQRNRYVFENLIGAPSLSGTMRESPNYQILNAGFTDRIFLIGHADGLDINEPHQVVSMREAVRHLKYDSRSPLLRGMLEAYYGGARDIWIMASAPMDEFVENPEHRVSSGFYSQYHSRLEDSYRTLLQFDEPEILVPLNAPFYGAGSVDFITQLAEHCADAFDETGTVRYGIIGTQGVIDQSAVDFMASDSRLSALAGAGKFVFPVVGEGAFNLKEMPVTYTTPIVSAVAALCSTLDLNMPILNKKIPNLSFLSGNPLTNAQVQSLANAKLNAAIRTQSGKRGRPFEVVLATDNTVSADGSDYWSLMQVRLIQRVIQRVRSLGRAYIGTIAYGTFKQEVSFYLQSMSSAGLVRGFDVNFRRDPQDPTNVFVDIVLQPYFGIRDIRFTAEVGPSLQESANV